MKALALGLVFTLLLLLPMPTVVLPQALAPPNTTEFDQKTGLPNGRLWLQMTGGEKTSWLLGFSNGVFLVEAIMHPAGATQPAPLEKLVSSFFESKLSLGEKVQGIDHFYQDTPENALVLVTDALRYVTAKANGAPQSELDDLASGLRKAKAQ